jgi:hypothetical protein
MKKINFLLFLLASLSLASCSDDDNNDIFKHRLLIGEWNKDYENYSAGPIFYNNGSVKYRYIFPGPTISNVYGDWTLSGDNLKIFWDYSDPGLEVYNTIILELTETQLVWKVIRVDGIEIEETFTKQ